MKKIFTGVLATVCFAVSMGSFSPGVLKKAAWPLTSGTMSVEDFQKLKAEEEKAISQGMQDATKKK